MAAVKPNSELTVHLFDVMVYWQWKQPVEPPLSSSSKSRHSSVYNIHGLGQYGLDSAEFSSQPSGDEPVAKHYM